jgi:hypothetical protein
MGIRPAVYTIPFANSTLRRYILTSSVLEKPLAYAVRRQSGGFLAGKEEQA